MKQKQITVAVLIAGVVLLAVPQIRVGPLHLDAPRHWPRAYVIAGAACIAVSAAVAWVRSRRDG